MVNEKIYETMFSEYGDILSIKDIQKILGISRTTVYDLIAQNKIKYIRPGKSYLIPRVYFINYILNNTNKE